MELDGFADAGFGPVADAFAGNFEALGEVGAAVAVYHRGRLVVDLAGGADPIRDRPFTRETLMMVASCTKGATATSVVMLADAGAIALAEPIARRWPEFGQAGKGEITVRQVLSHQAGLPYPEPDAPLSGLERIGGGGGRGPTPRCPASSASAGRRSCASSSARRRGGRRAPRSHTTRPRVGRSSARSCA